jgi:NitT/TauT family transport system substrate-binding protein
MGCQKENPAVKIGLLRIDDSIPFFVAEKEGLFTAQGVAAELVPFNSSIDQSRAMEAGELDMVMNDMIVQSLMRKGGTETKVVAIAFGANPGEGRFLLAASPGSGLSGPAADGADRRIRGAAGLTVAISSNTMMDYLLSQFAALGFFAPDLSDLKIISMPNLMLRVEALIEGRDIQMAVLPDPLASYAVYAGCPVLIDDTALGLNLSQSVVLASQKILTERREAVEKVLAAYFAAMNLVNGNPDTYPTPRYTPWALPSEEDVARVTDWMVLRGLLEAAYGYADLVDPGFVRAFGKR